MSQLIADNIYPKILCFPSAVTSFTLQLEGNKCLTWFGYPNKSTKFEHVIL